MQQTLITIGMLIGGLGLFLMAVNMITEGLKQAAGRMLRDILSSWTRSSARGILTGLTITALVQSSSAVTVATIGFVNAGLISLYQASISFCSISVLSLSCPDLLPEEGDVLLLGQIYLLYPSAL